MLDSLGKNITAKATLNRGGAVVIVLRSIATMVTLNVYKLVKSNISLAGSVAREDRVGAIVSEPVSCVGTGSLYGSNARRGYRYAPATVSRQSSLGSKIVRTGICGIDVTGAGVEGISAGGLACLNGEDLNAACNGNIVATLGNSGLTSVVAVLSGAHRNVGGLRNDNDLVANVKVVYICDHLPLLKCSSGTACGSTACADAICVILPGVDTGLGIYARLTGNESATRGTANYKVVAAVCDTGGSNGILLSCSTFGVSGSGDSYGLSGEFCITYRAVNYAVIMAICGTGS